MNGEQLPPIELHFNQNNTQYTIYNVIHNALLTAQCTIMTDRAGFLFVEKYTTAMYFMKQVGAERKWRGLLRVHLLTTKLTVQNHMRATSFDAYGDGDCDDDDDDDDDDDADGDGDDDGELTGHSSSPRASWINWLVDEREIFREFAAEAACQNIVKK